MQKGFVRIKCPRCNSTSEVKASVAGPFPLLCPVCLESEIEFRVAARPPRRTEDLLERQLRELIEV